MELIFKIFDTPGRSPVIRKLDRDRITIGRAYDNDLILSDTSISPHHALIETDENGNFVMNDLNSLNGIYLDHAGKVKDSVVLKSGSEYSFGKTPVRIFTSDHPVVDAVEIGESRKLAGVLGNPLVLIGAVLVVSFLHAIEQWLTMVTEFKWRDIVNIELVVLGSAMLMGIFWAVIGRIFRHEANFRKQVTVILVFISFQFLLSRLFELLLFNTLNYTFSLIIMLLIEFVLIATLLWFNLLVATNQSPIQRSRTAIAVSIVLIVLSLYTELGSGPEFSDSPEYVKLLDPPQFMVAGSVTENEFLSSMTVVFDNLDSE